MNDSTSDTIKVDTARLPLLLRELRLPTIAAMWQDFTERADREGWPAARLLATLTELELAERDQRRIQRHLLEARLPPGKTLDSLDCTAVPMLSRAHVAALATGDGWIHRGGTSLGGTPKAASVPRLPGFRDRVWVGLRHAPCATTGGCVCALNAARCSETMPALHDLRTRQARPDRGGGHCRHVVAHDQPKLLL